MQPGQECGAGRLAVDHLSGIAKGPDLLGVEGLEQLTAAGKVAVERRHPDLGPSRDLGH